MAELRISHASRQIEADRVREVECEISAVGLGLMAETLAGKAPGTTVKVTGFLAKKSRRSFQLVLHLNKVEFI